MKLLLALVMLSVAVGGCAAERPAGARAGAPAFYVPSATIVEAPGVRPPNPYAVLASADEQGLFFPRGEKYVEGPQPLLEISSASTYTYDAQNISAPFGFGYRYSYVTRSAITSP